MLTRLLSCNTVNTTCKCKKKMALIAKKGCPDCWHDIKLHKCIWFRMSQNLPLESNVAWEDNKSVQPARYVLLLVGLKEEHACFDICDCVSPCTVHFPWQCFMRLLNLPFCSTRCLLQKNLKEHDYSQGHTHTCCLPSYSDKDHKEKTFCNCSNNHKMHKFIHMPMLLVVYDFTIEVWSSCLFVR